MGFAQIEDWFIDEGHAAAVGSNAVCVYVVLKLHANKEGQSCPGLARIMRETGLSKPTVILALKALQDREVSTPVRQSGIPGVHRQTVVYQLQRPAKPVKDFYRSNPFTGQESLPVLHESRQESNPGGFDSHTVASGECECLTTQRVFEQFWNAYPRKENKKRAREWWIRHAPNHDLVLEIAAGLKRWKQSEQWRRGVIPHALTWLQQERWQDQPTPAEPVNGNRNGHSTGAPPTGRTLAELAEGKLARLRGRKNER